MISTEVMIEMRAVLTRKLTPPLSFADTQAALQALIVRNPFQTPHELP